MSGLLRLETPPIATPNYGPPSPPARTAIDFVRLGVRSRSEERWSFNLSEQAVRHAPSLLHLFKKSEEISRVVRLK